MTVKATKASIGMLALGIVLSSLSTADAQRSRGGRRPAEQRRQSAATRVSSVRSVSDVRKKLEDIHAAAKKATSIEEYTDSLRECKTIYEARVASPADQSYLRELSAWLYVQRGEAYGKVAVDADAKGDPQARTYEQKALSDFTQSIGLAPTWRAYHNRGVSHAVLSNFKEALADFNEAIDTNPKQHGSSFFNRAEVLYELSQLETTDERVVQILEAAVRDYSRALIADPSDVQALTGRAHAKFELQKPGEALRDFDAAIELDSTNAITFADRGDLYATVGEWRKAAKDLQHAIRLDRSLGRAYQSAAWLMATCPDASIRNPDLALQAANRALQLDGSNDYRYLDTSAAAFASAGQFKEAEDVIHQAMQKVRSPEVLEELRHRLATYQAGRPYRETQR